MFGLASSSQFSEPGQAAFDHLLLLRYTPDGLTRSDNEKRVLATAIVNLVHIKKWPCLPLESLSGDITR